jgi:hypothetical protein
LSITQSRKLQSFHQSPPPPEQSMEEQQLPLSELIWT